MLLKIKTLLLLCGIPVLLSVAGFSGKEEEDTGVYIRQVYDTASKCSYEYVYEDITDRLISISRLYGQTNIRHGISCALDERNDTTYISYYKKGETTPLILYGKKGNRLNAVSEFVDDVATDSWRREYPRIGVRLKGDTAWIDYALQDGRPVFSEWYDNGQRMLRQVLDQQRFDSLKSAYYSITGEQIFQQNCASCHTIGKSATGPNLQGVSSRHAEAWLRKWIANSSRMVANGDPEAVRLTKTWQVMMTNFPFEPILMDKLIAYLKTL